MEKKAVLEVRDLVVEYRTGRAEDSAVRAVRGVDFDLYEGESVALIGESGCGKTTLALALLQLLPKLGSVPEGTVRYRPSSEAEPVDILGLSPRELRRFRWNDAAVVFQGAMNSFNPVLRIVDQMADTIRAHERRVSMRRVRERAAAALRDVQLDPDRVLTAYPHELSGGMRQRVLIAMAMLLEPRILILDEPTTALDILTQRAIIDLIHELHTARKFSMLFVSHDLAVAAELSDRVATMYDGRIVEANDVREIFYRPQHDYTRSLINAVPTVTETRER